MKAIQHTLWSLLREKLPRVGLRLVRRPNPGGPRNRRRPGLGFETLEDRLTPASFFYQSSFGNLALLLDAGDNVTVQESAGSVTFNLSQGRWFSIVGSDRPTIDSGPTLGFDAAHPLFGSLDIEGGPTTSNVTFLGGNIIASHVFVELDAGLGSAGAISFANSPTNFTGIGSLNFITRGPITQSVPITTAAAAAFATDANVIALSNPANDFMSAVSVTNKGSVGVTLADANNIVPFAISMETGPLTIEAGGVVDFAGPWNVQLTKGGPSFQAVIGAGATGVELAGATLAGQATGFVPQDTAVLVNNLSSASITGNFTNGSQVILGQTGFTVATNTGSGTNDAVLTAVGSLNQVYVSNLYLVLLERPVDSSGLATWTAQLDHGASRQSVVAGLMSSQEYLTLQVTQLYQSLLRRPPDDLGLAANVQFLQSGGTIRDLKANFLGSPEYFQTQGNSTNDGWLMALYPDVLGRLIDQNGLTTWTQQLNQGVSRTAIANSILLSTESSTRLVEGYYPQYLGRPADPSGLQTFSSQLAAGASEESVIMSLLTSDEFFHRPPITAS
jgi:hypothetical protein